MSKSAQELIAESAAKKAAEQKPAVAPKDVVQSIDTTKQEPDTATLRAELAALKAANEEYFKKTIQDNPRVG